MSKCLMPAGPVPESVFTSSCTGNPLLFAIHSVPMLPMGPV
jgi:hypothetical protein